MNTKILHTPDGVRDIYGKECFDKKFIEENLHKIFVKYGYSDIETPTIEYFDVFSEERGSVPSRELYKFFDREGDTLVLRPDITPSIARCASKFFNEEQLPIRLCYNGNIYINRNDHQGKLKEHSQLGAELICDNTVYADGEMVAMAIESLLASGLSEFQVEVGQVNYFNGLVKDAGIEGDEELISKLYKLIEKKNFFGIEEVLTGYDISEDNIKALAALPQLFGDVSILDKAAELAKNEISDKAIINLKNIYEILKVYGYEKYVSFDLGMLSNYKYYTGVIFKGYTYGAGESLVGGGRYDLLLSQFGKNAPAVGFGININVLMNSMAKQGISIKDNVHRVLILHSKEATAKAMLLAGSRREEGHAVTLLYRSDSLTKDKIDRFCSLNRITEIIELQ